MSGSSKQLSDYAKELVRWRAKIGIERDECYGYERDGVGGGGTNDDEQ